MLHLEDLDIKYPPEMVAMQTTFNSRTALNERPPSGGS